jgi:hypothetical protein
MNLLQCAHGWGAALVCALALGGCTSTTAPQDPPLSPLDAPTAPRVVNVSGGQGTVMPPTPAVRRGASERPRDALVLLSGGGTPLSNHYSQYVQAKALTAFFARNYPNQPTWIFFGHGNRPDVRAEIADAHHIIVRDGLEVDSWVPGVLPNNRAATRANFLKALREEILPTVRGGGTLYLFIGDHGELTKGDNGESAITMWQLKRGTRRRGNWSTDEKEVLSVADLRQVIAEGIGNGRVVFCMTQCHSGGFHYLGIPREMAAPRSWFASAPEWQRAQKAAPGLRVAGFTATDEASIAAGCISNPDPENWAGYERFAPESVIGVDLMTERVMGPPRLSLAAAHEAATLVDTTIDKPRATSEQYLERWAHLIETRMTNELRLTEKTRAAVAVFQRAVETGKVTVASDQMDAKAKQFGRYTERLGEQNKAAKELLVQGTRKQLEDASRGGGGGRGGAGRRGAMTDARRVWNDTLRPAWKTALLAPNAALVPAAAREFEQKLIKMEEDGRNFLLPRGSDEDTLLNEIYWDSTYAEPQRFDRVKAEAVTRWAAERREKILAWGKGSTDSNLRAAAEKIGIAVAGRTGTPPAPGPAAPAISRRTAAERVLFYRRVLAAWQFLIAMDARPELARLHELIELERTPLPTPAT